MIFLVVVNLTGLITLFWYVGVVAENHDADIRQLRARIDWLEARP